MGKRGQGGRHAEGQPERVPRLPGQKKEPDPTQAEPGSSAKIAVLAERFRKRQKLWHPKDKQREG
jgi:hypothetical protein